MVGTSSVLVREGGVDVLSRGVTWCGVASSVCSCDDEWDGIAAFETSGGCAGKGIVLEDFEDDSEGLDFTRSIVDANSRGLTCFKFPSDSDVENDWSMGRAASTSSGVKGEVRGDFEWSRKRDSACGIWSSSSDIDSGSGSDSFTDSCAEIDEIEIEEEEGGVNVNLGASLKGAGKSEWDGVGEAEGTGMDTEEIVDADSRLGSGTMSVHEDLNEIVGGREGGMGKVMISGSATASVHEAGIDGIESTGDVKGNKDENAYLDIDSGSGSTVTHEDASEGDGDRENGLGVIEMDLASDSGTTFVHEDTDEDDGGRWGKVRVVEMDSSFDSGTSFVHEGASGGAEGKVEMFEGIDAGTGSDSGTTFVHEDASEVVGDMENEVSGVIEGMVTGSGLGLSFVAEGAGVFWLSENNCENEGNGRGSDV
jgi:hypothetical protein